MKVDVMLTEDIDDFASEAAAHAAHGYDGMWHGESRHEPFLQSLTVARAAPGCLVGTSVVIAFARSPMTVANAGYDLARYTDGRFVLGLGSQIRPHVERRFSMPWSHPARRMREFVLAVRAIWACWQDQQPLDFRGEFYTHTLMTPNFTPTPGPAGPPPIHLAAVGPQMTEVTGEVADGFLVHPFHSLRYLTEVTVPALDRGAARSGRPRPVLGGPIFIATGRDDVELDAAIAGIRYRIAFYGSTPAYRPVLDLHGWGDLQPTLNALSKAGRWDEMSAVVPDEVVEELAVIGSPAEVGRALVVKYGGILDRMTVHLPYEHDRALAADVLRAVRSALAS